MTEKLILYGAGALALEVLTYLRDLNESGSADAPEVHAIVDQSGGRLHDCEKVIGRPALHFRTIEEVPDRRSCQAIICIGDPAVRWRVYQEVKEKVRGFFRLIHPGAYVAPTASIGAGAIISPFSFVGPFAQIRENALLNVRSTAGHDSRVGHSAVLSPHTNLNGFAFCGDGAFVGAGAVFLPSSGIGNFSKAASGTLQKSVVGDGYLVHGNPGSGRQMFKVPAEYEPDY